MYACVSLYVQTYVCACVCAYLCKFFFVCVRAFMLQRLSWIPGIFFFSIVWGIGGMLTGDSRIKFNPFFRTLSSGTDQENPRPKTCKINKVQMRFQCLQIVWFHAPIVMCTPGILT